MNLAKNLFLKKLYKAGKERTCLNSFYEARTALTAKKDNDSYTKKKTVDQLLQ